MAFSSYFRPFSRDKLVRLKVSVAKKVFYSMHGTLEMFSIISYTQLLFLVVFFSF